MRLRTSPPRLDRADRGFARIRRTGRPRRWSAARRTCSGQGSANVTVNQFSQNAIINWHTFNIGAGERTQFVQPNASSVILNRVTGGLGPSQILGSIDANGKVMLVNRDGFIFGAGAVINTGSFLATTSDIKNSDFMAGRYNFHIPGRPDASIVNMGTITAASGGFAALVAPGVRNSGTITATLGSVGLAAGNTFSLDMYGDRLITLGVNDQIAAEVKDVATGETLKSLVTNTGKLSANGGRVELTAAAARRVVELGDQHQRRDRGELGRHEERPDRARRRNGFARAAIRPSSRARNRPCAFPARCRRRASSRAPRAARSSSPARTSRSRARRSTRRAMTAAARS